MRKLTLIPILMGCFLSFAPLKGVVVDSDANNKVLVEQKVITEQNVIDKLDMKDKQVFLSLSPEEKLLFLKLLNDFRKGEDKIMIDNNRTDNMDRGVMKKEVNIESSRTIDINR